MNTHTIAASNTQLHIRLASVILSSANNPFTRSSYLTMVREIPAPIRLAARVDRMVRKHSAFSGIAELVASHTHNYRPTLYCRAASRVQDREELKLVADYYDSCMEQLGSSKRAYRV